MGCKSCSDLLEARIPPATLHGMDASYHSDYSNIEENLAAMSSQLGDASLSTYVSNLDSDVSYVSLTEASRLGAPSQRLSSYASQG